MAIPPTIAATNKNTGNRLRQQLVDAITGEHVHSDDKGRGYEVGENRFLVVEDQEVEAAEQEARDRPFSASPTAHPTEQAQNSPESSRVVFKKGPSETAALESRKGFPVQPLDIPDEPATQAPVRIENNRTIEIDRFVPRPQLDARYLDTPYYIVPRDEVGEEAFAVIRDAMTSKNVFGMGRVVLARRERPILIEPMGAGIRGATLRFAHEIRSEVDYFSTISDLSLPKEMLRIAEHIVETKTTDFDPVFLEDRYRTVLISKLKEKSAAEPRKLITVVPPAENVISLMDVLKKSLAAERRPLRSAKQRSQRETSTRKSPISRRSGRSSQKAG